jgi:hypothetical protein
MSTQKKKPRKIARTAPITSKPARKKAVFKPAGNPESRRAVSAATDRVLAYCATLSPTAAAKRLGVDVADVANMRSGYQRLTMAVLLKMVRNERFDPRSIIEGPTLRRLPAKRNTRGAQQRWINARMNKLAWSRSGLEWASLTGMSIVGAYGLRYTKTANVKLGTVLAFAAVGPSFEKILFGD